MFNIGDMVKVKTSCMYENVHGMIGEVCEGVHKGSFAIYFENAEERMDVGGGTTLHNCGVINPISKRYLHIHERDLEYVESTFWRL